MARERNRDESASANQEAFPGSRTHTSVRVFPALTPGAPQPYDRETLWPQKAWTAEFAQ